LKPVFIEETIAKLKRIIDANTGVGSATVSIEETLDEIEKALKAYQDNRENRILLYGTSLLVVVLALILIFTTRSTWPLMFLVLWFGGFMYYRVHEKSLVIHQLDKLNKVQYDQPITQLIHLKSVIDLKYGRKSILKVFLSVMISCAVMMAHYLFLDTSFWMNLGLLIIAIIASYFFWNSFYKEETEALQSMKDQLDQLESQIILGGGYSEEE